MQNLKIIDYVDYDDMYSRAEITDEVYALVKQDILKNGYNYSAYEHQEGARTCPLLSDLRSVCFSRDSWAALMTDCYYSDCAEQDKAFYLAHYKLDAKIPNQKTPAKTTDEFCYERIIADEKAIESAAQAEDLFLVLPFLKDYSNLRIYGSIDFVRSEEDYNGDSFIIQAVLRADNKSALPTIKEQFFDGPFPLTIDLATTPAPNGYIVLLLKNEKFI